MPQLGDKIRVFPALGRRVQDGPRPVDKLGGGRLLPDDGREVEWTVFHEEQLRAGDLMLHAPPKAAVVEPAKE